jgi:hypothetical protein
VNAAPVASELAFRIADALGVIEFNMEFQVNADC